MGDYLIRVKNVPDDYVVNVQVETRVRDTDGKGSGAHYWNKIQCADIPVRKEGAVINPTIEWVQTSLNGGYLKRHND